MKIASSVCIRSRVRCRSFDPAFTRGGERERIHWTHAHARNSLKLMRHDLKTAGSSVPVVVPCPSITLLSSRQTRYPSPPRERKRETRAGSDLMPPLSLPCYRGGLHAARNLRLRRKGCLIFADTHFSRVSPVCSRTNEGNTSACSRG